MHWDFSIAAFLPWLAFFFSSIIIIMRLQQQTLTLRLFVYCLFFLSYQLHICAHTLCFIGGERKRVPLPWGTRLLLLLPPMHLYRNCSELDLNLHLPTSIFPLRSLGIFHICLWIEGTTAAAASFPSLHQHSTVLFCFFKTGVQFVVFDWLKAAASLSPLLLSLFISLAFSVHFSTFWSLFLFLVDRRLRLLTCCSCAWLWKWGWVQRFAGERLMMMMMW